MGFADEARAFHAADRQRAGQAEEHRRSDQDEAQGLIVEFISAAKELGIMPAPIRVFRAGHVTERPRYSSLRGWDIGGYEAVGEDGRLYSTLVKGGLFGSWEPAKVAEIHLERENINAQRSTFRDKLLLGLKMGMPET